MSNSSLVSYKKISPNKTSPRNHKIDTITIHCVVGQCSVQTIGDIFANKDKEASSNYGIGYDGKIGMYVEEKDRSWCSSNADNDNRAITIECASDTTHPYAINDKVYKSLIELCIDICKRNNIKELKWKGDKSLIGQVDKQNMTVHRWFANKSCPGDYIYSRLGKIASEVNAKLKSTTSTSTSSSKTLYRVQVGVFSSKKSAESLLTKLKNKGFNACMVQVAKIYKIQVGAFSEKANAEAMAKKLKAAGFDSYITTKGGSTVSTKKSVTEIAKEVIAGKWGNGDARKKALTKAGYDYEAVQKKVNELL